MPAKAPHYHLMGGCARDAGPAAVQRALPRRPQPRQALPRHPWLDAVRATGQAEAAR